MNQPLTDQQLDEYEAAVAAYEKHPDLGFACCSAHPVADAGAALLAEVRRLRAAMAQIRHLHKDSPMGPCPVCIDADAVAAGGDGLVPYLCPTGRLAGAQDCDPPSFRASSEAAGAPVAAEQPAGAPESHPDRHSASQPPLCAPDGPDIAAADNPTPLRWGLNDVLWSDDDHVIVLLSGPEGEPYWLELDAERAAVLREDLAGPDGEKPVPAAPTRTLTESEYNRAWHAVEGAAGEEGADPGTVLHAVLERLGISLPPAPPVHACPPDGSGVTPCCGRTPFDLPRTDRMASDPSHVTCTAAPAVVPVVSSATKNGDQS